MKAFTFATLAIAGATSVAAVALEPRASPAPLVKRQDTGAVAAITGLLNPLTAYLTDSAIASLVSSVAGNPEFLSAAQAAATSDFAPIETLVGSLQADAGVSSAIYGALGSESASAFYASASEAVAGLAAASSADTASAETTTDSASVSSASEAISSGASSVSSSLSSEISSATSAAPASGAASVYGGGSMGPIVFAAVGVAAGAFLL